MSVNNWLIKRRNDNQNTIDLPITKRINHRLFEYYEYHNKDNYYTTDKRGLFLAYIEDNGYDDDDVMEELLNTKSSNCLILDFDLHFPFRFPLKPVNKRQKAIHHTLKYILKYNKIPKGCVLPHSIKMNRIVRWKITSAKYAQYMITSYYIRIEYKKYITNAIIILLSSFIPIENDPLKDIKRMKTGELIQSKTFLLQTFHWRLKLVGANRRIAMYIQLTKPKYDVHRIVFTYTLLIKDMEYYRWDKNCILHSSGGNHIIRDLFNMIDVAQLNALNFELLIDIQSIDYFYTNYVPVSLDLYFITPFISRTCKIHDTETMNKLKNATCGDVIYYYSKSSDLYMLKSWNFGLEMYPNGDCYDNKGFISLYICLLSLPKYFLNKSIRILISIKETNTLTGMVIDLYNYGIPLKIGWKNIIKQEEIYEHTRLTINIKIMLCSKCPNDVSIPNPLYMLTTPTWQLLRTF